MSASNINSCSVCHQPITESKPASLVMVREGRSQIGADVHIGDCQKDKKVVHSTSTFNALPASRRGFVHRVA